MQLQHCQLGRKGEEEEGAVTAGRSVQKGEKPPLASLTPPSPLVRGGRES